MTTSKAVYSVSLVYLLLGLSLSLMACGPRGLSVANNDTIVPVASIEILGPTQREVRNAQQETVSQYNCGGTAEAENSETRAQAVNHTLEVGMGLEINANGQIGFAGTDVELGATLARSLGYTYGTVTSVSKSIAVRAAPGTNMEHTLQHEEIWESGTARIVIGDQYLDVPFSLRTDFSLRLANSRDRRDCDPNDEVPLPAAGESLDVETDREARFHCSFVNDLASLTDTITYLDVPAGSGNFAGVQTRIIVPIEVPVGWIVQRGGAEEHGPLQLAAGEVVTVWSPNTCRPLEPPNSHSLSNESSECNWLLRSFPQSPEELRSVFSIASDRDVRLIYEVCSLAANGFVLEEGQRMEFVVPEGGCIDSDDRAVFSDRTAPEITGGGRRAHSGTVLAYALTYRVAGCELKP